MSPSPATVRDNGKELYEANDYAGAETVFRSGHQSWPHRLDMTIWLARSLDQLGQHDERQALLDPVVMNLDVDGLPPWGRRALGEQGYMIHRGVRLCLNHPVISPWMRGRMLKGDYEEFEADMLASTIEAGDRILEVGGGLGFMAAFASLQAPDVTSVVYEANPGLVPVAEQTKRLSQVDFDFRNAMLGGAAGTAQFHVHEAFWASSAGHQSDDSTEIQVVVHDVNAVLAEQTFTMLVMDIEGGEIDLIPGMDLQTVTRIVIETHPAVSGERAVRKMLRGLNRQFGFTTKQHHDDVYLLVRDR